VAKILYFCSKESDFLKIMQKQQLTQRQKLKQVISQQTIQLMRLVELSNNSLEQEILKEVEENPALEIDFENNIISGKEKQNEESEDVKVDFDENYGSDGQEFDEFNYDDYYQSDEFDHYSSWEQEPNQPSNNNAEKKSFDPYIVAAPSFQEYLIAQLQDFHLTEREKQLAQYIIGYIDETGYLSNDIDSIATDFLLSHNIYITIDEVEQVLTTVVHEMDPEGVGARNLQESLLIQLSRKENQNKYNTPYIIIRDFFDEFSKKQYDKISKKLKISKEELSKALEIITHLNPKPIFQMITPESTAQEITPDFIISNDENRLQLQLNNPYLPSLKISKDFKNTFSKFNKTLSDKQREEAERFIKEHIDNANQLINALSLRELVLYNTMYSIMEMQKEYFLSGDEKDIKPMILKDIAEKVNLDISTISRVSNSKYVQTFFGIISLKQLFSESVGDDSTSSKEVKQIIKEIIENEDNLKPYQDEEIMEILNEKGYSIARRTVSKYRKQLNIPVARLRVSVY